MISYVCTEEDNGVLLSSLLTGRLDIYSSTLSRLKYGGGIYINGEPVHVRRAVKAGDLVELDLDKAETPSEIPPEEVPLDIIYESAGLIAVNKPAMSVVHPTCFHRTGTVAAGIVNYYRSKGISSGIHLVNRLDLGTSGILIFARYGLAQERMRREAEAGTYRKIYLGVLDITDRAPEGIRPGLQGTVDAPIARDRSSIINRKVDPSGSEAVTDYHIIAVNESRGKALAAFSLRTGRTHQIRVHMNHIGLPLACDSLYNPACLGDKNSHQLLHQYYAAFEEPITKERTELTCPVPEEFEPYFPGEIEKGMLRKLSPERLFPQPRI
jgi:RluA family pseudouridine synthase